MLLFLYHAKGTLDRVAYGTRANAHASPRKSRTTFRPGGWVSALQTSLEKPPERLECESTE